jgi:hypothetical protein
MSARIMVQLFVLLFCQTAFAGHFLSSNHGCAAYLQNPIFRLQKVPEKVIRGFAVLHSTHAILPSNAVFCHHQLATR